MCIIAYTKCTGKTIGTEEKICIILVHTSEEEKEMNVVLGHLCAHWLG
jgi:ribosomal protein L21E